MKNGTHLVDGTPINARLRRLPVLFGYEVHHRHGTEQLLGSWVNLMMQNDRHAYHYMGLVVSWVMWACPTQIYVYFQRSPGVYAVVLLD